MSIEILRQGRENFNSTELKLFLTKNSNRHEKILMINSIVIIGNPDDFCTFNYRPGGAQ